MFAQLTKKSKSRLLFSFREMVEKLPSHVSSEFVQLLVLLCNTSMFLIYKCLISKLKEKLDQ